jgi:hypothetical protein
MAVKKLTRERLNGGTQIDLITWAGMATGDTGEPFESLDWGDLTVTFSGTFGVGTTAKLRGSNNGTDYFDLTDPQGNAISKSSSAMEAVTETPRYIRPEISGGSADAVDCQILARRGSR